MRTNSLITVVIPTYKRPRLLRRAILSVLNQTYPNFIIQIYDNASGDETEKVVSELAKKDKRLKYYCHQKNMGAGYNFYYGYCNVDTPYFCFLSDDDVLLPDFFKVAVAKFDKHPEVSCVATRTVRINENGEISGIALSRWKTGVYDPGEGAIEILKNGHPVWTGVLWRNEVRQQMHVDANNIGDDAGFAIRVASMNSIYVSDYVGALFLVHEASNTTLLSSEAFWVPVWELLIKDINSNECLSLAEKKKISIGIRRKILNKSKSTALIFLIDGMYKDALRVLHVSKVSMRSSAIGIAWYYVMYMAIQMSSKIPMLGSLIKFMYNVYFGRKINVLRQYDELSKKYSGYLDVV